MSPSEAARLQAYLQELFGNAAISIKPPAKPEAPAEMSINDEFLAVIYKDDEDEDDLSYSLHMTILDEDLPED